MTTTDQGPTGLARNDDPWQSHEAAELVAPKLGTRKAACLALFRMNPGEWIDAARFNTKYVGGVMSGTRRVRELRQEGYPIQIRRKGGDTWQYRMLEDADPLENRAP